MGMIETAFEQETGLTLVRGTGKLTLDDFQAWMDEYYPEKITGLILWDETGADLSGLDTDALRDLARRAKKKSGAHQSGKGAIVYATALEYGLGRIFQAFAEIEGLTFEVQSFQSMADARAWLGVEKSAPAGIQIDKERRIITRTVTGELYTNRSLSLVRELAMTVNTHRGYHVLMDMRETVTRPEMLDLMSIASECSKLRADFNSRIAFLIPDTEDRRKFAKLFRACMEAQGFTFRHFFDRDAATAWLEERADGR